MNEAELLDRANKAKVLLENPVFNEGFEAVRTEIIRRIEACPMAEAQTAEELRKCLKLLRDVRANIEAFYSQGKIISFKLEQERVNVEKRRKFQIPNFFR